MNAVNFLFSFSGRISRQSFWGGVVGLLVVFFGAGAILSGMSGPDGKSEYDSALAILMLPGLWISLAIQVKRWHDRGRSGWRVLINLIPVIGAIWAFVELGILPGTAGTNQYGPDPLAASIQPPVPA